MPIAASKLDLEQLHRVSKFRQSLSDQGGLVWPFNSADELEKLIRLHLSRFIQQWRSSNVNAISALSVQSELETEDRKEEDSAVEDEVGILDLVETIEDDFSSLTDIAKKIAEATEVLGKDISLRRVEIDEINAKSGSKNVRSAKRIIGKAAEDMNNYVHRMDAEVPLFSKHLESGMDALMKMVAIFTTEADEGSDQADLVGHIEQVGSLRLAMSSVADELEDFLMAAEGLPRATTALNRAKRALGDVLRRLIAEIRGAERLAQEAEGTMEALIVTVNQ